MKLNFFEAWNWYANFYRGRLTFRQWIDTLPGSNIDMFTVNVDDPDFAAWVNDRKNPNRTFFTPKSKDSKDPS